MVNSIVAGNTVGDVPEDCSDPVLSEGHNIEGATSCGFDGEGDKQNTDPRLAALAANGGATQTRAIGKDSPAFDAAESEFCTAADQRGVTRPQFAGCDIGAFELAPPPPTQPGSADQLPAAAAPRRRRRAPCSALGRALRQPARFRIKLRVPRGERVVKAVVRVNGKRVLVRRGTRLTVDREPPRAAAWALPRADHAHARERQGDHRRPAGTAPAPRRSTTASRRASELSGAARARARGAGYGRLIEPPVSALRLRCCLSCADSSQFSRCSSRSPSRPPRAPRSATSTAPT